ncbi:MAG: hypothetical protein ACEQSE_01670 [Candidatus Aquirickettsiella gammari]
MNKVHNPAVKIVVVNLVVVNREIHDNDKPARASIDRALSPVLVYGAIFIKVVGLAWNIYYSIAHLIT